MSAATLLKSIAKWRRLMADAATDEDRREMYEVGSQNIASEFGYPIEVTPKMLTGELPMDAESVAERAESMYMGDTFYRGHDRNYPPRSDQDMYMSDNTNTAQTYGNTVTPLRHNADNLLHVEADGMGYEDVYLEPEMVPDLNLEHWLDMDNVDTGTDGISYAVKGEGFRDGTQFNNIIDDYDYSDEAVPGTVQNILGSKPDIKIRHPDAAFDPQYNGPNIMGGATVPMLGLLSSGTAGAGLLLKSLFADAEKAKR
jgi:hypothetical protein